MKTIEQAAQECAEKLVAARNEDAKEWAQLDEITLTTPIIAAAMSEVCEPLEREAKAQGEHAVAMTEHAQSLQKELAEAKADNESLRTLWTEIRTVLIQSRAANCVCSYGALQADAVEAANAVLQRMPPDVTTERDQLRARVAELEQMMREIETVLVMVPAKSKDDRWMKLFQDEYVTPTIKQIRAAKGQP